MSLRRKLTAAGLAVGVLCAVLAGSAATANASPQSRAPSGPDCTIAMPGHPGKTVTIRCPAGHPSARVATASANRTLAVAPNDTPPDSVCRGDGNFGWFGVAPGSSADGGVANNLWWDATLSGSPAQIQLYSGNGGANQQWCEQDLGSGEFGFYAYYQVPGQLITQAQCLMVKNGYGTYSPGMRVVSDNCQRPTSSSLEDEIWYVCPRSGNSISLEPAGAPPSSVWLDVWGGFSDNGKSAFVQGNPLQLYTGNGQDNQRFTLFPSPGEPSLPAKGTGGVPGC